jgi:hypothetical protein
MADVGALIPPRSRVETFLLPAFLQPTAHSVSYQQIPGYIYLGVKPSDEWLTAVLNPVQRLRLRGNIHQLSLLYLHGVLFNLTHGQIDWNFYYTARKVPGFPYE